MDDVYLEQPITKFLDFPTFLFCNRFCRLFVFTSLIHLLKEFSILRFLHSSLTLLSLFLLFSVVVVIVVVVVNLPFEINSTINLTKLSN